MLKDKLISMLLGNLLKGQQEYNVVDDKERAGVVVTSKSEHLEAMQRILPEAIRSRLSTSRNLASLGIEYYVSFVRKLHI